ncbi:hypothetical protein AX769_16600 [Frondihabitans sp. PAMC 28766]|nr:hypothetical protein AX769_16600 [Frondihabitans sp. PAMC 28766]
MDSPAARAWAAAAPARLEQSVTAANGLAAGANYIAAGRDLHELDGRGFAHGLSRHATWITGLTGILGSNPW